MPPDCLQDSTRRISAMRQFAASATIEMRRVRPRSEPTRWRNQQLRALSGGTDPHPRSSIIRGTQPWIASLRDRSMLPLFHGLGAKTLGEENSGRLIE